MSRLTFGWPANYDEVRRENRTVGQSDAALHNYQVAKATLDTFEARRHLNEGRAIMARLVQVHPDWMQWKQDLAWFDGQLTELRQ